EDQVLHPHLCQQPVPLGSPLFHVRTVLLGGVQGLFFSGSPSFRVARQTVGTLALCPSASASSASVMSGLSRISSASCSRSASSSLHVLGRLRGRSSRDPVSRRRWISRRTQLSLQPKVWAVSRDEPVRS